MIYLDHNATAPLLPAVRDAMEPWLDGDPANPSSVHRPGQRARAAVEEARGSVAALLGVERERIVFTSGGTEANNLALWGALGWPPRGHLIVSAVEHPSVLEPASALEELGVSVDRLPVDGNGVVAAGTLADLLRPETTLVSVMVANNETGVLQPVAELARIVAEHGAALHCDAVQAGSWTDLEPVAEVADLLTLSAHKLGGPPGIGALYVGGGMVTTPFLRGGGQQLGRRAGTEPTALIVGFGAVCDHVRRERPDAAARVRRLRDRLEAGLLGAMPDARVNGGPDRIPNTTNVSFPDCAGDALVARLDLDGLAASGGAACSSGVRQPSHVLTAMGIPERFHHGSLRLSLGYGSDAEDVRRALEMVPRAVNAVRDATAGDASDDAFPTRARG